MPLGKKTLMGALGLLFLALGNVLQPLAEGKPVDWNRAITDITIAASILGAAKNGPGKTPATPPQ